MTVEQPGIPGMASDKAVGQNPHPAEGALPQLGLTVDHRRLFRALQDSWLRPPDGNAVQVLGVHRFPREAQRPISGRRIAVQLSLSASKLPDLDTLVFRDGRWMPACLHDLRATDVAMRWPGAVPAFAISSIAVPSSEERNRLIGMSRVASNLDLSDIQVTVADAMDDCGFTTDSRCEAKAALVIPASQDSIHGALTMAVWAVPRIDPWMDVLQASVAADPSRLLEATIAVDAPWWRFPPWGQRRAERPGTLADCLWLAAMDTFQDDCDEQPSAPRDLLVRIAEHALRHGCAEFNDAIAAWQDSTARILSADATVQVQNWRKNPVGVAIQLVLTRPEPDRFKTWFKDLPNLPPGVAWSAATLCGLLNGYKRLATDFRGCTLQRELLSVEALSVCSPQSEQMGWPNGRLNLRWRQEAARFMLSHGNEDFASKPQHARGKWYAADFRNAEVRHAARSVAEELGWPCDKVSIEDMAVPVSGTGKLEMRDGHLEALGRVDILLPRGTFDVETFRRLVATESAEVPAPPVAEAHAESPNVVIPGLTYETDFLDEEHEQRLVEWIDKQEWSSELARRVQHYGWRYDYKARGVDPSMRLGELPPPLAELAQRLYHRGLVPQLPDQAIVNEYEAGQGISSHVDAPKSFADGIATISLLESWEMNFHGPRSKGKKGDKVPQLLERRSVAVMQGEARLKWKHEIVKRKSDPQVEEAGGRRRRERNRRISLTFRKVQPTARRASR